MNAWNAVGLTAVQEVDRENVLALPWPRVILLESTGREAPSPPSAAPTHSFGANLLWKLVISLLMSQVNYCSGFFADTNHEVFHKPEKRRLAMALKEGDKFPMDSTFQIKGDAGPAVSTLDGCT